ncbi:MAG TPA: TonB-dependent receptor [Phycisphaerales bacterium]|nr:TonB-dependent receptor [Phycisphaerales bacterium]
MSARDLYGATVILAALCGGADGQVAVRPDADPLAPEEAVQLSLEQLMSIDVTSVSGVEQQLLRSPAAVDVITGEDIRRTGHRSIAEALRLAPGVFVGRTASHGWAISPRGMNGLFANKTLVLMDGRRLYDPLHGGTFWDVQDPLLGDVDRIEVIRGPGATLWGANAANGVINIITKSTEETLGVYLQGGAGTYDRGFGAFRYGGKLGDDGSFRIWSRYRNHAPLEEPGPGDANDEWDLLDGGFRAEFGKIDDLKLTFETRAYHSFTHYQQLGVPVPGFHLRTDSVLFDQEVRGGHALFRAESFTTPDEGWSLLAYYDRTERREIGRLGVERDSFELDARYHFTVGQDHALIAGAEIYYTMDSVESSQVIGIAPDSSDLVTFSAFVQDTITIAPDRWFVMLGSKFEHNDFTGFEAQPSARLWFTPDDRQTLWTAVSRSVRTPSRVEDGLNAVLFFADTGLLAGEEASGEIVPVRGASGNPGLDAEEVLSYELGYRNLVTDEFSVDVAGFFNRYEDLISLPPDLIDSSFNNDGAADAYGVELAADWRPASNWRLRAGYSYTEVNVRGPVNDFEEGESPHNMAHVTSYLDVTEDLELNAAAYYVDRVPFQEIEDYVRLDLGLTYRVSPKCEIALWGQNLLEPRHNEFSGLEVERSAYLSVTLRF